MPANAHLEWREFRNFAEGGGLYTRDPFFMPVTASQKMDGCYPQQSGGLRAFMRKESVPTTGIAAGDTGLVCVGVHAGPFANAGDQHLATYSLDTGRFILWNRFETGAGWETVLVADLAAGKRNLVTFADYQQSGQAQSPYVMLDDDSAEAGVYRLVAGPTLIDSDLTEEGSNTLVAFQERLVRGHQAAIRWSDPGGNSIPSSNFLALEDGTGEPIVLLIPFSPTDLVAANRGGQFFLVQGDLADPTVRFMGSGFPIGAATQSTVTPLGVALVTFEDGVYITDNGTAFQYISPGLDPADFTFDRYRATDPLANAGKQSRIVGTTSFSNNFLFAPPNYTYDIRTQAWFRPSPTGEVHAVNRSTRQTKTVTFGDDGRLGIFACSPKVHEGGGPRFIPTNENAPRNTEYTWKSAPFRGTGGRQVEVREVQILCRHAGGTGTNQISVTVGDKTVTKPVPGPLGSTHLIPFLFRERGHYLDVEVHAEDLSAVAIEAPMIEAVRIGTRPGHRIA